jgi:hypothetical protein
MVNAMFVPPEVLLALLHWLNHLRHTFGLAGRGSGCATVMPGLWLVVNDHDGTHGPAQVKPWGRRAVRVPTARCSAATVATAWHHLTQERLPRLQVDVYVKTSVVNGAERLQWCLRPHPGDETSATNVLAHLSKIRVNQYVNRRDVEYEYKDSERVAEVLARPGAPTALPLPVWTRVEYQPAQPAQPGTAGRRASFLVHGDHSLTVTDNQA